MHEQSWRKKKNGKITTCRGEQRIFLGYDLFIKINIFSVFGAKQSGTLKAVKAGEITEEELTEIGLKHGAPPVQLSGTYHCFHIGSKEPEQKILLPGFVLIMNYVLHMKKNGFNVEFLSVHSLH